MTYSTKNETDYTIEEMVDSLKSGDSTHFEPLFLRFDPLMRKLRSMYQVHKMEEDDFYQEARIVLHEALRRFKKGKGLQFAAYYKLLLQNHVFSMIRKETAAKRKIERHTISFDLLEENQYASTMLYAEEKMHNQTPEQIVQAKEATNEGIAKLSPFEKEVLGYYLAGEMDNRAIAEKMDRTLVQVQQAYDRCMRKLKQNLR